LIVRRRGLDELKRERAEETDNQAFFHGGENNRRPKILLPFGC